MNTQIIAIGLVLVLVLSAGMASAFSKEEKMEIETDYILSCQYTKHLQHPAYGAINDIYGDSTWVVPRKSAMAILGLVAAPEVLNDESHREHAPLAADYLIEIQNASDGAWYDLDEDAAEWGIYEEGSPTWVKENVATPSIDGNSLRCSITGGDPYSNVHCYREFPPELNATEFTLCLYFWFSPPTTFNNQGAPSIVQALEFTMNKWHQSRRYEFAFQWQNVGDGAPQWRYWDPHQPEQWVSVGITDTLEGEQWHSFTLKGEIIKEQVHYRKFIIDQQNYNLDITVPPASTPGEPDRLAVAIQLDGNFEEDPYDVFIDHVSFVYTDRDRRFDTGSGTYPSIMGTHNGTIKLNQKITVSTLYTYPCPGTGGHTEYVKIWNSTDWNVTATWDGYAGDWQNISFDNSFTLYANETYNYTIKTGSYPQLIHAPSYNATDGVITCTDFTDANGKRHEGWIPAIRLE